MFYIVTMCIRDGEGEEWCAGKERRGINEDMRKNSKQVFSALKKQERRNDNNQKSEETRKAGGKAGVYLHCNLLLIELSEGEDEEVNREMETKGGAEDQ